MSNMNDKHLLEHIKSDAGDIEIPEGIIPENMMKRLREKKETGYFEESKSDNKGNKRSKKGKRLAFVTGGVATVLTAASLAVVLLGTGVLNNFYDNTDDRMIANDFYTMVSGSKWESESELTTLRSYEDLRDYIVVSETMREKVSFFDYIGDFVLNTDNEAIKDSAMGNSHYEPEENFGVSEKPEGSDTQGSNQDYSETNTRTENVAEADVAKTDGKYIYYLSGVYDLDNEEVDWDKTAVDDIKLSIVKAAGEDSEFVSSVSLRKAIESTVDGHEKSIAYCEKEILIYNDKLAVVCGYYGYTVVLFYDVTERSEPKLTDKLYVEGNYDSCRFVDGYLYIFAEKHIDAWGNINYEEDIYTEEKAMELLAPDCCGKKIPAYDVYVSGSEVYDTYHMIATVDMNDTTEFKQVKAILGEGGEGNIYVSKSHIYYISNLYEDIRTYIGKEEFVNETKTIEMTDKSEILSLTYEKGEVKPKDRAVIEGRLGDEFAVDEYNGYLRLAVSTSSRTGGYREIAVEYYDGTEWVTEDVWTMDYGWSSTNKNGSALYILDENLDVVGSIPQLKERENVYGVRFDGDIAYVVTYEQMDPLFSIDLSDPTNPTILGALKIPGFSTYLHKWDDNTLIGLGYNEFGELKISTFDITDKTDVIEKDICNIEDEYWSPALYDHKAVFISPEKNLIGFIDGSSSYRIFSYVDGVLTEVINQRVQMNTSDNARGMYIGEYIYIIGELDGIHVYNMNTYEKLLYLEMSSYMD